MLVVLELMTEKTIQGNGIIKQLWPIKSNGCPG
jgi:hypothetical protein